MHACYSLLHCYSLWGRRHRLFLSRALACRMLRVRVRTLLALPCRVRLLTRVLPVALCSFIMGGGTRREVPGEFVCLVCVLVCCISVCLLSVSLLLLVLVRMWQRPV